MIRILSGHSLRACEYKAISPKAKKVPGSFSFKKGSRFIFIDQENEPGTFFCCWVDEPTSLRAIQGHASERKTTGQKPRRFVAQRNNISAWSEY
jgi:hypothetical protein